MADEQPELMDKDKTIRRFKYGKDFDNKCRKMSKLISLLPSLAALVLSIVAIVLVKR